ncbi:MAG: hypothetical protein IGS39_21215 [Calothrix sp. C42_A2020_038]|nr:hypothetical protein [Calothrix sp. C42_A2020_038]
MCGYFVIGIAFLIAGTGMKHEVTSVNTQTPNIANQQDKLPQIQPTAQSKI